MSYMDIGVALQFKGLEHCQNAFKTAYKVKRVDKATVLCESL